MVLAALAGAVTTVKGLAADGHRLNIFWVLAGLLGLSWLSLTLWLLTLRQEHAGVLAPAFRHLLERLLPARPNPTAAQAASRAWLTQMFRGTARWRLGWINHLIWSGFLAGGLAGLVLLFTLRQFDFVWESTLLHGDSLVRFTEWLGAPLTHLGLVVPDANLVAASRIDAAAVEAGARRTWALFLLECLLVYGLLPRLFAGGVCRWMELRVRARRRWDLNSPYYVHLQRQFAATDGTRVIVDPDTHPPAAGSAVAAAPARLPHDVFWLGLELPQQFPLPAAAQQQADWINVRDAASLAQAEAVLRAAKRAAALLVDGDKTPDRGLQRMIRQMANARGAADFWLVLQSPTRYYQWLESAAGAGLEPQQVVSL